MSAWTTYDWLYLCSDPRRLAITLRALPKEPLRGLRVMQICWASHLDPPERPGQLGRIADSFLAPRWLQYELTDLSPLKGCLPERLQAYWNTGKKRWSLGMKLLMPYILEDHETPYLYTDDDVLITRDPREWIAETQYGFGSKGCFRFDGRKRSIAEQLFTAFDVDVPVGGEQAWDRYDRHALDAGVWFNRNVIGTSRWSIYLDRFARMPYLADLTTHNLELRCLDQRFLTCFGIRHGWDQRTIGNGFAPPRAVTERLLTRHPFFHYKSSSKEAWMRLLEAYLDSRG